MREDAEDSSAFIERLIQGTGANSACQDAGLRVIDEPELWHNWMRLAQELRDAGRRGDAILLLEHCLKVFPELHQPALHLAYHQLGVKNHSASEAAFDLAITRNIPAAHAADFKLVNAWARRDWETLATMSPPIQSPQGPALNAPWVLVSIARYLLNDIQGGHLALANYRDHCPDDGSFLPAMMRYLLAEQTKNAALQLFNEVDRLSPQLPELEQSRIALSVFYPALKTDIRSVARQAFPAPSKLERDWAQVLLSNQRNAETSGPSVHIHALLNCALQSAIDDRLDDACEELELAGKADWPPIAAQRIRETFQLITHIRSLPPARRRPVFDDRNEILVTDATPSGKVAIIFIGLAEKLGGIPLSVFDQLLAKSGYQGIYLRDRSRRAYTHGVRTLGQSAFETVEYLKRLLDGIDRRSLHIIGFSGGGYAALRYGLELDSDRITTLAGGTVARPEDLASIGDTRVSVVARLSAKGATGNDFTRPVHEVLAGLTKRPKIDLFFGSQSIHDRAHAELLMQFSNVTLHPLADLDRHDVATTVLAQDLVLERDHSSLNAPCLV